MASLRKILQKKNIEQIMRFILKILIGIVVAYFLAVFAFKYEKNYREIIRNLYQQLSENTISFKNYGKYFHFSSGQFISAFTIFSTLIFSLLKKQENRQRIKNFFVGSILILISTTVFCDVDGFGKLIECTACDDGKRIL